MKTRHKKPQAVPSVLDDGWRYYGLVAGLCFAVAVVLRLVFLNADPPWNFTWSQALFTDGARAIDGARSKILFGDWIVDMRSPVVLFYPLVNLIAFVIFKVGGVGLAQANLVGVLPGLASISLLYVWMRKLEGKIAGLIALAVLSLCYVHVIYSRVPMVESLLILMLLIAFYLALSGRRALFFSGLVVGSAAFMVKLHALHFVPVVLVYLLLARPPDEERSTPVLHLIAAFLAGCVAAFAVWFAFVYFVNPEVVAKYFRSNILIAQKGEYAGASLLAVIEKRLGAFIHLGSGREGLFAKAPVMSLAAVAGLICAISGLTREEASIKPWEKLAAIWFAGLVAALSFLSYRPLRYLALLTPSVTLLAASFIWRLARGGSLFASRKPGWYLYAFIIWLAWVLIHIQQDITHQILSSAGRAGGGLTPAQMSVYRFGLSVWPKVLIFGGAAVVLSLIFRRRIVSAKAALPYGLRKIGFWVLIAGIVVFNSVMFLRYADDRKYSIIDGAGSLDRVLSEGAFLVGDCSTTMSLESGFRTLPAYGDLIRYDEREEFEKYPITHFVIRFPTLYEYLTKNYPDFNEKMVPVRNFVLCGRDAVIVRYENWPGYGLSSYKPSEFEQAMGLLNEGRIDGARSALESFMGLRPGSYEALLGIAICDLRQGRNDDAARALEQVFELTQRDALSHEIYGDILSSRGREMEARDEWEKALKLNPNSRNLKDKLDPRRR
ncbi:MAG: tetratricopeptide repeat protein [Candidatus Eisenbacteria bacterium]